jgi:peptide/nickel transport system permease protein
LRSASAATPVVARRRHIALKRFSRSKTGMLGAFLVITIALAAAAAPLIAPYNPDAVDLLARMSPPLTSGHLLGTDIYGRDLLSRLIWGGRLSLAIGLAATLFSMGIGIFTGISAGYFGGRIDSVIMRLVDIMLAFPYILLAIVIVGALGPGLFNTMLAVGIAGIAFFVRLIRGMVVSIREETFVEAARSLGATHAHIMFRAVLPALVPYIIVFGSLNVGWLILEAASLSFLGLGAQPPTPEWGAMLAEQRQYVTIAPHVVIVPGIAIFLVVIGLNLFGDALRDALDVRLKET